MGLRETIAEVRALLDGRGVRYALIGGLALGVYGVKRATLDVDLLIDGADRERVREAFADAGYEVIHDSNDVLQLARKGAVDILWANRPPTRTMLAEAGARGPLGILVVRPEDVIGLKIQALVNDPTREHREKADLAALASALGPGGLDLARVRGYAERFGRWNEIEPLLQNPATS